MPASKNRRKKIAPSKRSLAPRGQAVGGAPPPLDGRREDFAFDFHSPRIRVTDSTMLQALRDRHTQLNRPFTIAQFDQWPEKPCGGVAIQRRFGSWRQAMKFAGIEGAKGQNYTPEELIQNLESAWRSLGRRPGNKSLLEHGTIGVGPYNRVWGGVRRACLLFSRYKRGQITRRALLRPIPPRPSKQLSKRTRWRILERDGQRCGACGRSSREPGVRLEVDHIMPVSAGGPNDPANLRALCQDCNRGKAAQIPSNPRP